jgi:hypothetical protein
MKQFEIVKTIKTDLKTVISEAENNKMFFASNSLGENFTQDDVLNVKEWHSSYVKSEWEIRYTNQPLKWFTNAIVNLEYIGDDRYVGKLVLKNDIPARLANKKFKVTLTEIKDEENT